MGLIIGAGAALAALYFWLLGHWFAWIVVGGFLAFCVQIWAPMIGIAEVAPESSDLFLRMIGVFLLSGVPCFGWGSIARSQNGY